MSNQKNRKLLSGILSVLLAMQGISSLSPDALTYRRTEKSTHSTAAEDAFSITGGTVMTDITEGSPVIVKGIVTSAESFISVLTVGVYAADGTPVIEQTVLPNAPTYDLYAFDSSMSFNLLDAGEYCYRVTVSNMEYDDYVLVNQEFTVTPSDAPEDALTLTDGTVMTDIAAGTAVELKGTVLSAETPIISLTVGVYDLSGNLTAGVTIEPDGWYCNLNSLDDRIAFELLPSGEYYYNVTASNSTYQDLVLTNQKFRVLADVPATEETTAVSTAETTAVTAETTAAPGSDSPETTFVTTAITVEATTASTETSAETTATETTADTASDTTSETTTETTASEPPQASGTETTDYQYKSITAKGVSVIPTLPEGSSFDLQGIVSCSKADMEALTALIYNAKGETVLSEDVWPAAASYDLQRLSLPFETLTAGSYSFKVFVSVQGSGALPVIYQTFDVAEGGTPVLPEDTLTLTGSTKIVDIVKGTPVSIAGTIRSAVSGITAVEVGVYDMDGNLVTGKTEQPDAKIYDLSQMDSSICFDLLDAGIYEYRITAGNAANPDTVLLSRSFSVLETAEPAEPDALVITDNPPILNMPFGARANSAGTVRSAQSAISRLTVGIYDMNGEPVCEQTVQPDTLTYDLNELNSEAMFSTLLPAIYEYRITADNATYPDKILVSQRFTVYAVCR